MRFLRDSTFMSWTALVLVLGGVMLFAHGLGSDVRRAPLPGQDQLSVVAADRSKAADAVNDLSALAPYGIAAGTDKQAVQAWGARIAQATDEGAATRAAEGAPVNDPLLTTFALLRQRANALVKNAGDPVAVNSLRTNMLLLITRSKNLIAGLPVPANIDALGGGSVTPQMPSTPTVTTLPTRPILPQPLPGAGAARPMPDLSPDPVTPEDLP